MTERIIEITHEPFTANFDVKIVPPVPGEVLGAEFPTHKQARGWASGLRLTHGWRIVDRTCLGDGIGK
ncbi:hypothetical protein [Sphingobium bisphenolivorans]|uniref:hypothetical protein n=1 Tax=Sphingobium bisphenolivorans TaxID=1335760 RepID=UPI0003A13CEB|nr:hypothetical protein [Sphingobium bisphenolivorans]